MLTASLAAFEIRYQLKNPVFWVSVAIFFLLGFGIAASADVSIGTPGAVHEKLALCGHAGAGPDGAVLPFRDHLLRRQCGGA